MIKQLPKWVELGAFMLALLAGMVNAVGLLSFEHQSVSHLSGTATLLGQAVVNMDGQAWHLLFILLSFLLGAIISGALIDNTALKFGRHYTLGLLIEAILLLLACMALLSASPSGHYFASAACGLQNALVTSFSGAIIRTTHITGVVTDLGIMIGALLRGQKLDIRKMILFGLIVSGFIIGGSIGTLGYQSFNSFILLLLPAVLALILALAYQLLVNARQNRLAK